MTVFLILLGVYFLVIVAFVFAINLENVKNDYQFNVLQLIVAVFWPIWGTWYLWEIGREAFVNWKNK